MTKPAVHLVSRKMPAWACPSCGRVLDGITAAAGDRDATIPVQGSLTVCCYCGTLLVIGDGHFEFGTAEQLADMGDQNRQLIEATIKRPISIGGSQR